MSQGLRVLALATRALPSSQREFGGEDEAGMLFRGFLVFLDPPKASALPAIAKLHDLGIKIKVRVVVPELEGGFTVLVPCSSAARKFPRLMLSTM